MNLNQKFKEDLEFGFSGENQVVKLLQTKGLIFIGNSKDVEDVTGYEWKYYDLLFKTKLDKIIKVEVKTDNWVTTKRDSGNIPIEISCNTKQSGIRTTKSDVWVYQFINLTKDNVWIIKTKDLKKLLDDNRNLHVSSGGDNNSTRLILIPRDEFKKYFTVLTN